MRSYNATMPNLPRKVSNPLGRLRAAAGFETQKDAAQALDCSKIYVSEMERGGRMPSPRMLALMAKRYSAPERRIYNLAREARIALLKRELKALKG